MTNTVSEAKSAREAVRRIISRSWNYSEDDFDVPLKVVLDAYADEILAAIEASGEWVKKAKYEAMRSGINDCSEIICCLEDQMKRDFVKIDDLLSAPADVIYRAGSMAEHDSVWPDKHPTDHTFQTLIGPALMIKMYRAMVKAVIAAAKERASNTG